MKNLIYKIALFSALTLAFSSCKNEEDLNLDIVGLGGDTWEKGPLDEWIYSNFTQPYNIEVKYRWDRNELAIDKNLVPVKEEQVMPIMNTVRGAWINPYTDEAGDVFIKRLAPKQYVLVGSYQYNTNGTVTLGEAEGGRKVTLFRVNEFDPASFTTVQRVLKTIHHEFGHILQQNVAQPRDYQLVTPSSYTADWNTLPLTEAYSLGFISQYARAEPKEDFVEMLAFMLTRGQIGYEALVRLNITNTEALAAIRKKEAFVRSYLEQVWNIDLNRLQVRTAVAMRGLAPNPPASYFGFDKGVTDLNVDQNSFNVGGKFKAHLESAGKDMAASGRIVAPTSTISYTAADEITLKFTYTSTSTFQGNFTFKVATDANGNYSFTYSSANTTNTVVLNAFKPLTDYLSSTKFRIEWVNSPDLKKEAIQFTDINDPTSLFNGTVY